MGKRTEFVKPEFTTVLENVCCNICVFPWEENISVRRKDCWARLLPCTEVSTQ